MQTVAMAIFPAGPTFQSVSKQCRQSALYQYVPYVDSELSLQICIHTVPEETALHCFSHIIHILILKASLKSE